MYRKGMTHPLKHVMSRNLEASSMTCHPQKTENHVYQKLPQVGICKKACSCNKLYLSEVL